MANEKIPVRFRFGTRAQYDAIKANASDDSLYFLSDTGEIYKGKQNLARGHYFGGARQEGESDTQVIARVTSAFGVAEGDIFVVEDNLKDNKIARVAYVYNGVQWMPLTGGQNAEAIVFAEDLTINGETVPAEGKTLKEVLESLSRNPEMESIFDIKGEVENKSDLDTKTETAEPGDIFYVKETEEFYVYTGESWEKVDLNVDLSSYITGATVDGEEVPVEDKKIKLSSYVGNMPGLVPNGTGIIENKSSYFLNADGQWKIPVDSRIGSLKYKEVTYDDVTQYIDARMEDVSITWDSIDV